MIEDCSCWSEPILTYTESDHWLVFGEETQSAAMVLGVIFGFSNVSDDDEPS